MGERQGEQINENKTGKLAVSNGDRAGIRTPDLLIKSQHTIQLNQCLCSPFLYLFIVDFPGFFGLGEQKFTCNSFFIFSPKFRVNTVYITIHT